MQQHHHYCTLKQKLFTVMSKKILEILILMLYMLVLIFTLTSIQQQKLLLKIMNIMLLV